VGCGLTLHTGIGQNCYKGSHGAHSIRLRSPRWAPAERGEGLSANSSDTKSTEGLILEKDPWRGILPSLVEKYLVEEHSTQYCIK